MSIDTNLRWVSTKPPRLFGQQLADVHSLVSPIADVFEIGLDWHHVLDTMLTPMKTPTQALTDRLKILESVPARITIISFIGSGDRYDSAHAEMDIFRDQSLGCQRGGDFHLVKEKTGRGILNLYILDII